MLISGVWEIWPWMDLNKVVLMMLCLNFVLAASSFAVNLNTSAVCW